MALLQVILLIGQLNCQRFYKQAHFDCLKRAGDVLGCNQWLPTARGLLSGLPPYASHEVR